MADEGADEFRDPENEDSLVDVVQKAVLSCMAENLVGVVDDVAAAVSAQYGEQVDCHADAAEPSSGRDETDGAAAAAAAAATRGTGSGTGSGSGSKLVLALASLVSKIIRDHRTELEAAVAQVVRQSGEQLKLSIKKIWDRMFHGREFKWMYLIVFLAFAALLVLQRKVMGTELEALARTVATFVGELIVKMWRVAFVKLGGWVGFLKKRGVDGAVAEYFSVDLAHMGSRAFYTVLFVLLGYGLYGVWNNSSSQPPKLE